MSAVAENEIVRLGETFGKTVRFSAQDIAAFAAACHDSNPLHSDESEAGQSRFGLAVGAPTASMLLAAGASRLSPRSARSKRQMVCLNFSGIHRPPVADAEDITLHWVVSSVEWNRKLDGYVVMVDGAASTQRS